MSYSYSTERPKIFTDEGQREFLKVRDRVRAWLENAGAVRMQEVTRGLTGDGWVHMAYLDRLVELGEIRELTGENAPGQYRVFVKGEK